MGPRDGLFAESVFWTVKPALDRRVDHHSRRCKVSIESGLDCCHPFFPGTWNRMIGGVISVPSPKVMMFSHWDR